MVAFWQAEMDRRGLTADDMSDEPPVGANLLDQVTYDLPDCEPGDGIDADDRLAPRAAERAHEQLPNRNGLL